MNELKMAVLGARGIGKFHVREFASLGCKVTSILGETRLSSENAAKNLYEQFGISVNPYHKIDELLEKENIDAVSICTPPELHEQQIIKCLNRNLHILCEKPFILDQNHINYDSAKQLLSLAKNKNKILTVNTQWAFMAKILMEKNQNVPIKKFTVLMEPGNKGENMILDHISHANSILVRIIPEGSVSDIIFEKNTSEEILLKFNYSNNFDSCEVVYKFRSKYDRPREVIFGINEDTFVRKVNSNYKQEFEHKGGSFPIEDPLRISIRSFINSIRGKSKPLVTSEEILENILLQEKIINEFHNLNDNRN